MQFLQKIERRFGRFAIPHLIWLVVLANALGYLAIHIDPRTFYVLVLDRDLVMHGQVWRLVSYLFIPPSLSPLWIVFALYLIWLVGEGLEHEWGAFRFNLYYFIGMTATTGVAFFLSPGDVDNMALNTSLFLAFATIYPNFELYLFFIIPVKVKWLGILSACFLAWKVLFNPLPDKLAVLASLLNYFLFFWPAIRQKYILRKQVSFARARFQANQAREEETFHRCAVCGKTEISDPDLHFRVSRNGQEYCLEHLPAQK